MHSPRRIRVAYCLDSFTIGGTELNAVRTAEALDPDRIELCVIHLQTHGPLRSRYERLGVRMEHLPIPNLYSPRTAVQGIHLARLLRRWNVDVVHSRTPVSSPYLGLVFLAGVLLSPVVGGGTRHLGPSW